ncbi:MAG: mechanosensitive ion channel family protein, partial [Sphingomicrobium sp.]
MTSTTAALSDAATKTEIIAKKGAAPVVGIFDWIGNNLHGLMIGSLIAFGIVGIMLVVRSIGRRLLKTDPDCLHWRGVTAAVLAKTGIFFMVAAAVEIVTSYAPVPAKLEKFLHTLFIIAAAFQFAVWARELVLGVVRSRVGEEPGESTLGNAMSIIRVLVSVAAFAIAGIVILDNLGVNVTTLVAGLGVGGIAIGLAAQGIFSDLFAALSIVFDRPFRRGDTVRYGGAGGSVGTVERIGLKTTRIRSISGEQLIISNTKLLEQELTNVAEAKTRRVWLPFGVIYQTSPEVIDNLPKIVDEVLAPIKGVRLVRCCATNFGDSSIDIELVYDDRTSDACVLAEHKSAIIIG